MSNSILESLPEDIWESSSVYLFTCAILGTIFNVFFILVLFTETNSILTPYKRVMLQNCAANILVSLCFGIGKIVQETHDGRVFYIVSTFHRIGLIL